MPGYPAVTRCEWEYAMDQSKRGPEPAARSWARTASEAFHAAAALYRSLPESEWTGPTGCAQWDQRTLCGHILGEAVWFPNLLRGVTRGEQPYPMELYDEMKAWPAERQSDRLDEAADELVQAVDDAIPEHLESVVDVGWSKVPLWRATYISVMEGVYHEWDARAGSDRASEIPTAWAVDTARGIDFSAPLIAHHKAIEGAQGRYRLDIGEGLGTLDIHATGTTVEATWGSVETPDVTIYLTADQAARLVAGRFKVAGESGVPAVRVDGDAALIAGLGRIFGGIANG